LAKGLDKSPILEKDRAKRDRNGGFTAGWDLLGGG